MEIKESKEAIAGIELLLVDGKKILADKKVNLADLPVAMDLLGKMNLVIEGISGANLIPAEIKDLSGDEAKELLDAVLKMLAAVKAA